MPTVIILSGPSGSGKTTWARTHHPTALMCSADHFFMKDGEYAFNPSLLGMAHSQCMHKFLQGLKAGVDTIVVDNTNIREWEWCNYALAAQAAGYDVLMVVFVVDNVSGIRKCAARNSHGTPIDVIANMALAHDHAAITQSRLINRVTYCYCH